MIYTECTLLAKLRVRELLVLVRSNTCLSMQQRCDGWALFLGNVDAHCPSLWQPKEFLPDGHYKKCNMNEQVFFTVLYRT